MCLIASLLFLLATMVLVGTVRADAEECQFRLGFATLRDLLGHSIVGPCLENERYNAIGDSVQRTAGGLLVWRKADNWTAFTDGYYTWVSGPFGVQKRLNVQRYFWEADYANHIPIPETIACIPSEDTAYVETMRAANLPYETEMKEWHEITNEPLGNVSMYKSAEWQGRLRAQAASFNSVAETIMAESPQTWQGKAFHAPLATFLFHIAEGTKTYIAIVTTVELGLIQHQLIEQWFPHLDRATLFADANTKIETQPICGSEAA